MRGHGGDIRRLAGEAGRSPNDLLDFSASINPLGMPDCVRGVISRNIERLVHYPDPEAADLVNAICRTYGLPAERVIVGNGSTEILFAAVRRVRPARAMVPVPSYIDYATACSRVGVEVGELPLRESEDFAVQFDTLAAQLRGDEAVLLGQPNNPTGRMLNTAEFRHLAAQHPRTTFLVDEAFADFVPGYDSLMGDGSPNVIVLRSLTKFYAIPGLRLGFAVAGVEMAERLRTELPPWSVNTMAQAVGAAVLADADYADRTRRCVADLREQLATGLQALPDLHVFPSAANYLLVQLTNSRLGAAALTEGLLRSGIAIRRFGATQHLDDRFFRVAVRTREENARLLDALGELLGSRRRRPQAKRRAATIMFQGTSSNAGKSVLTAALCRILLQDGMHVAPFKSQNMSLNSFVTANGLEMGRAQVVQAQACRLDPDVRMNPVLLKPSTDTGCQVIVRGRPVGNMKVGQYISYKAQAFAAAKNCFDSLAAEFDAVVLEGAGSPGEINLKSHDIVNMQMARHAGSPVLVIGDIDRGGVFASFVGTMEVLADWERAMVAGWVVNRFRGDASLLGPALDYTLAHTGRAVFGVVPFVPALNLPQEDSVEFKSGSLDDGRDTANCVEIAVIDLPHISNFTDLDALGVEPDVRLRIVRDVNHLGRPDAIILPGSKNTLADLTYLRRVGLADRIAALAEADQVEIVGICGGFQMLGRAIGDPNRVESDCGSGSALGLLAVDTVLATNKTLTRTVARHAPSGSEVVGYEIHHGLTDVDPAGDIEALFVRRDGRSAGVGRANHRVWGTYLHGVFDSNAFRRWFVDRLRVRRGLPPLGRIAARYDIEPALDRVADFVRRSLDMKAIYRLLRLT